MQQEQYHSPRYDGQELKTKSNTKMRNLKSQLRSRPTIPLFVSKPYGGGMMR